MISPEVKAAVRRFLANRRYKELVMVVSPLPGLVYWRVHTFNLGGELVRYAQADRVLGIVVEPEEATECVESLIRARLAEVQMFSPPPVLIEAASGCCEEVK